MKKIYYCLGCIALSVALVACGNDAPKSVDSVPSSKGEMVVDSPGMAIADQPTLSGKVVEVMDASGYTYVGLDDGSGDTLWAAIPQTVLEVGEEVTLQGGSIMKDFSSKTLNRTFAEIIFSSGIISGGSEQLAGGDSFSAAVQGEVVAALPDSGGSAGAIVPFADLQIEKAMGENARTIAEVFIQANELDKQKIAVKGQVVKISRGIMGKNWIHIQDGTGDPQSNTHDLVVTTDGDVEQGAVVTVEGVVAANKDFGAGYKYDVIVEEAVVTQ